MLRDLLEGESPRDVLIEMDLMLSKTDLEGLVKKLETYIDTRQFTKKEVLLVGEFAIFYLPKSGSSSYRISLSNYDHEVDTGTMIILDFITEISRKETDLTPITSPYKTGGKRVKVQKKKLNRAFQSVNKAIKSLDTYFKAVKKMKMSER